ncbi:MAG: hypothetical protein HOD92_09240 [Deltaproteobacteria bacterium]|nr:hypothetical protein [Deltaproteobacteria bacterium]
MPKCTVLIDNHLSPAELQLLLSAISLFRGVQEVTLENEGKNIGGQPLGSIQNNPQSTTQYNSDDMLDPDTQRYFIDEVIRWAVKNNHLHLEDVRRWSPEEIISQAVEIFESMSEQDKITVGQNVSKHAERIIIDANR